MTASSQSSPALDQLREVEKKLYSPAVEAAVGQLTDDQKQSFVSARLNLTAAVGTLEAGGLEALGQESAEPLSQLSAAAGDLEADLEKADQVAGWAGEVESLSGLVSQLAADLA